MKFLSDANVNTNRLMLRETILGSKETLVPEFSSGSVIYSFGSSENYLAAKFSVKTKSENTQSLRNLLILYDGYNSFITEYGIVSNSEILSNDVFSFSKNNESGEFELSLTPSSSAAREVVTFFMVMIRDFL